MGLTQEMVDEFSQLLDSGDHEGARLYYDLAESISADKGAEKSFSLGAFGLQAVRLARAAGVTLNKANSAQLRQVLAEAPTWTDVDFLGGSYSTPSDAQRFQWWKDPRGFVHLKGRINLTAGSTNLIAQMPVASRSTTSRASSPSPSISVQNVNSSKIPAMKDLSFSFCSFTALKTFRDSRSSSS